MFSVDWDISKGWLKPKIVPFGNVKISPFCGALNYAVSSIESFLALY